MKKRVETELARGKQRARKLVAHLASRNALPAKISVEWDGTPYVAIVGPTATFCDDWQKERHQLVEDDVCLQFVSDLIEHLERMGSASMATMPVPHDRTKFLVLIAPFDEFSRGNAEGIVRFATGELKMTPYHEREPIGRRWPKGR
jgi:hypothetical protein